VAHDFIFAVTDARALLRTVAVVALALALVVTWYRPHRRGRDES